MGSYYQPVNYLRGGKRRTGKRRTGKRRQTRKNKKRNLLYQKKRPYKNSQSNILKKNRFNQDQF